MAGGQSSFDRDTFDQTHGNYDFGHFLSTSKFGNVMLDQKGPGCVYRIWMTSLQSFFPNQWIKIYFDGAAKPAINMTIGQIFAGTNAPFLAPLVEGPASSSGGYTSYVPLCYHRSIEIVTNMDRYYDIGYVTYAPNANVTDLVAQPRTPPRCGSCGPTPLRIRSSRARAARRPPAP